MFCNATPPPLLLFPFWLNLLLINGIFKGRVKDRMVDSSSFAAIEK